MQIEVLPDAEAAARRAAELVAEEAAGAPAEQGHFTLALSRAPRSLLDRLAELAPLERMTIYQVDERVAPAGHADRNLTQLRTGPSKLAGADLRPMPVEADELEPAAADYARSLPHELDVVHLGLGPDGHTASLVPGDPVLEESERDVAATGEYMGRRRMTLTYPALDRARRLLWLVTGEAKADVLRRLLDGDTSIPAGRVARDRALVIADEAAAGRS